jgi:hypothetical protein
LTVAGGSTLAAFATDGGRVGIVRFDSYGDLYEPWGDNGVLIVEGTGRDGIRASSGLANDVRYLAEDQTGGLVVAMSDGVVRRYVSTSFVPGGLLFVKSPAYSIVRARSTVPVEVNRIGHAEGTVTVRYDVGGDCTPNCSNYAVARAGEDFVASSGVLEWAPGERGTKIFNVEILAPTTSQPAEVIPLKLSSLTGGASLASPNGILVLAPETVPGGGGGGGLGGGGGSSNGGGGGGGAGDAALLALLACLGTLASRRSLRQSTADG